MRYNEQNSSANGYSRARKTASRSGASGTTGTRSGAARENRTGSGSRSGSSRGTSSRSTSGRGSSARGTSSGTGSRRGASQGSSRRTGARASVRSGYSAPRSSARRRRGGRRGGSDSTKFIIGGVVLILAITCIVFLVKGMKGGTGSADSGTPAETDVIVAETELEKKVKVDGIDITGMSREEARAAILKDFPWSMKVTWGEQTADVNDLMAGKVDALLDEIYHGEPEESYTLDTTGLEDAVKAAAADIAAKWDKKAKNGSISSYDASKDKFIFSGAENGAAVNQEKLAADIQTALNDKKFDAVIEADVQTVAPEFDEAAARERYERIGTFTTKTTANKKRNTNVRLSAEALNGTVIQPGQEFSFNETVGQRTAEKGYQGAAAYNNGEVVEEIGGGVCQTSSTLYNAVVKAGLTTTVRRSHTYEPSYVTPGTDATVSWGGPDYKFVNNTSAGIGIRAHYADQTITISIYGIPVLEKGETRSLKSTKIKEMDLPAPTYEEDPTLEPGAEKVKSRGSQGSKWETRLVITKDGKVVSEEVDHHATYKGHTPVILRNSSGVQQTLPQEGGETVVDPNQTIVAPEGAGDGLHQEDGSTAPTSGNGGETQSSASEKPDNSATSESTQAKPTKPADAQTKPSEGTAKPTEAPTKPAATQAPTSAAPGEGTSGGNTAPTIPQAPTSQPGGAPGSDGGSAPGSGNAPSDGGIQMIAPNPGQ